VTTPPTGAASTCRFCLAWGILPRRQVCVACTGWRITATPCAGCGRRVPIRKGYCRLCLHQATLQLGKMRIRGPMPVGVYLTGWQLWFAGMTAGRSAAPASVRDQPSANPHAEIWAQLTLFEAVRDFTRFSTAQMANPDNPMLIAARRIARQRAETYGWSHWLAGEVDLGLVILLSQHLDGDQIRYSQITPLDRRSVNVSRTAEVLTELGLLLDDRPDPLTAWIDARVAELAPGIAHDVRSWAIALRTGQHRTRRHPDTTVRHYLRQVHPHLLAWSADYEHLREITSDHIRARINTLQGLERKRVIVSLRSLFAFAHRTRRIFGNPTAHIKPGGDASPARA
jgi:hypothetical protein